VIRHIHPKSPVATLRREYSETELEQEIDAELVAAVVGMSRAFIARALDRPRTRPKTLTLADVLLLLDLDGFQETFVPRSRIPDYLLAATRKAQEEKQDPAPEAGSKPAAKAEPEPEEIQIQVGNTRDLLASLDPGSVQCAVTSSPYWGMRRYDDDDDVVWGDGEECPYGFEQTPEGFIRHTVELMFLLKPAIAATGSVWWNLMDTYNTRTPIRVNARERLDAMGGAAETRLGWTEHEACRHSAGHMYLDDAEQASIPSRVAERASRIGYKLKSFVTWKKHASTPEPVRSRVTRQAEYILHLSVERTPLFEREAWQQLPQQLGGPHPEYESSEKITDVWCLPTSTGKNGHGAEFPLALPGRCIALTSEEGDLVLDPFMGSGTTALAAVALGRRCVGFDISEAYVKLARERVEIATAAKEEAEPAATDATPPEPDGKDLEVKAIHEALRLPLPPEPGEVADLDEAADPARLAAVS
jgi:DNA modification methylase